MSFTQELENSIDIVELVSKYTRLKKAGVNYKSNCPFPGHSEKTPSFVVSPVKQIAYCFGCHRWWGPIKFLMDIENYEFKNALELLGEITGKKVQYKERSEEEKQEEKSIYQLFKDATYYYHKSLSENEKIVEYFEKRRISWDDIKTFQLWYSESGQWLLRFLKERWFSDKIIEESQIFSNFDGKKDKFFWRIIFPLQSLRGETVAFAGRVVGNGEPKYLNSPASKIYDKSAILYWLYQGKKEILERDYVIICEGYMDTIALHRAGFKNTVCVSGTALTEKHIDILKRLTKRFYLCFDNDKAWLQATESSIDNLKNKDIEIRIILLSGWKDADEIIASWENFDIYLQKSISPIAFYIEKNKSKTQSIEDKKIVLREALSLIKSYSNGIERDTYIKELASILSLGEKLVYDEFNKLRSEKNPEVSQKKLIFSSQELAIAYILTNEENKIEIEKNIAFPDLLGNDLRLILNKTSSIENFPLEKKEKIRWLSLKLEEETLNFSQEKKKELLKKLSMDINTEVFLEEMKKKKEAIKSNPNSIQLLEEYNSLLLLAKRHKIKA